MELKKGVKGGRWKIRICGWRNNGRGRGYIDQGGGETLADNEAAGQK